MKTKKEEMLGRGASFSAFLKTLTVMLTVAFIVTLSSCIQGPEIEKIRKKFPVVENEVQDSLISNSPREFFIWIHDALEKGYIQKTPRETKDGYKECVEFSNNKYRVEIDLEMVNDTMSYIFIKKQNSGRRDGNCFITIRKIVMDVYWSVYKEDAEKINRTIDQIQASQFFENLKKLLENEDPEAQAYFGKFLGEE